MLDKRIKNKLNFYLEDVVGKGLKQSEVKAELAILRRSIGKNLNEEPKVWPLVYKIIPEDLVGESKESLRVEKVVYGTLQLFALHQQGVNNLVHYNSLKEGLKRRRNIGYELKNMRLKLRGNGTSIDKRFSRLLVLNKGLVFTKTLEGFIKIYKKEMKGGLIDYIGVLEDLYKMECSRELFKEVKFSWGKEYFKEVKKEDNEEEFLNEF